MCRRCGEPDRRGSNRDRKRRRSQLLEGGGGITTGGNGVLTACVWCNCLVGDVSDALPLTLPDGTDVLLPVELMEQDRIQMGGPYALWNLVASCGPCNRARLYEELEIAEGCLYGPETLARVREARVARDEARELEQAEEAV